MGRQRRTVYGEMEIKEDCIWGDKGGLYGEMEIKEDCIWGDKGGLYGEMEIKVCMLK